MAKQPTITADMQALMRPRGRRTSPDKEAPAATGQTTRQKQSILRIRPQNGLLPDQANELLAAVSNRLWDALPFSGESRRRNGLLVLEPEEPLSIPAIERCLGPLARQVTIEAEGEGGAPAAAETEEADVAEKAEED